MNIPSDCISRGIIMKDIMSVIIVLAITNIGLHILINYKKNRGSSSDFEMKDFSFGRKLFSSAILPTIFVIVIVADTMLDWIVIYIYFLMLTYIANSLFTKYQK